MIIKTNNVAHALHQLQADFLTMGSRIERGEWQALRDDRPQMTTFEINDVVFRVSVPQGIEDWQRECKPNLPWAEDHFQERVSGTPLNPGEQYKNWPWYEQGVEEHKPDGQFSHTYMERFWPRYAGYLPGMVDSAEPRQGIHFRYGDLFDLVELLRDRPYTRQAYLPIWFPEDITAAGMEERVPCTLGYHFLATPSDQPKKPDLRMTYNIRSCDWFRYLRDDLYMAGRLLQWVAERVDMRPHYLTMHINNLHIFSPELSRLMAEYDEAEQRRLSGTF